MSNVSRKTEEDLFAVARECGRKLVLELGNELRDEVESELVYALVWELLRERNIRPNLELLYKLEYEVEYGIGREQVYIEVIKRKIREGWAKDDVLEVLEVTEEEYAKAEEETSNVCKEWKEWEEEIHEEAIEQGIMQERNAKIQCMIRKGLTREFILELDYTEEDYARAEEEMRQRL